MTYFGFLLRFLVIPIAILSVVILATRRSRGQFQGFRSGPAVWWAIGLHVLIAVLYTTPWDNYLVATGVWYYDPELVTGILLGWVPIEEYTFFVLQTILTGLWWRILASRNTNGTEFQPSSSIRFGSLGVLSVVWLVSVALLVTGDPPWTYLSITLAWALPPIMLQFAFGADILWHHRWLVAAVVLVPTTFLAAADALAISAGTWTIAPGQSTGLFLGPLPIEELVFFLVTNTLIGFGMTLFLSNESPHRIAALTHRISDPLTH